MEGEGMKSSPLLYYAYANFWGQLNEGSTWVSKLMG